MKRIIAGLLLISAQIAHAQNPIDQNGLKTIVTNSFSASDATPLRYEIATIGFNSHHWQSGGTVVVELFNQFFAPGYEKYLIEVGYGQGANYGTPMLKLVASNGSQHSARIALGNTYDLSSSYGGFVNKALPVYLDVKDYAAYKARITYVQDKVDELTDANQIKINTAQVGTIIADFPVNTILQDNRNFEMQGDLTNQTDRPAIYAGTINGEIRGIGSNSTADDGFLRLSAGAGSTAGVKSYIDISGYMQNTSADRYQNITIGTSGQERMRIDAAGNVNIGTKESQGHKLSVNGSIRSKKVVVTQTGWPDYVFDSSYQLPSLDSVSTFIQANKHLPDMPSAAIVEKDGHDLGEVQKQLLKKVEELTLYVIAQKEKIESLEKKNEIIEKQLIQLKSQR